MQPLGALRALFVFRTSYFVLRCACAAASAASAPFVFRIPYFVFRTSYFVRRISYFVFRISYSFEKLCERLRLKIYNI